ncbi:hypothetical protein PPNK14_20290 [Pectobacterium parmentieri]
MNKSYGYYKDIHGCKYIFFVIQATINALWGRLLRFIMFRPYQNNIALTLTSKVDSSIIFLAEVDSERCFYLGVGTRLLCAANDVHDLIL